jgi:hypothetical protein
MTQAFDGIGALYEGARRLGEAHYHVEITWPALRGGPSHTRGRFVGGDVDLLALYQRNDSPKLTFHLEGGLRWDCRSVDPSSQLVSTGSRPYNLVDGVKIEISN